MSDPRTEARLPMFEVRLVATTQTAPAFIITLTFFFSHIGFGSQSIWITMRVGGRALLEHRVVSDDDWKAEIVC